jgi:hypothetical protein
LTLRDLFRPSIVRGSHHALRVSTRANTTKTATPTHKLARALLLVLELVLERLIVHQIAPYCPDTQTALTTFPLAALFDRAPSFNYQKPARQPTTEAHTRV